MCDTCGCGDPEVVPLEIQEQVLAENDRVAKHNGEHFRAAGVLAVNLMGSPGCGKTALLEATALGLGGTRKLAAVSGDLATENDARRLKAAGIPCRGITTGSACHLDARLVHHALHDLEWREADYFFIENVGNLVCPAIYALGESVKVVALSVTEGDDKPLKYPVMFRHADLVLLTKVDLLPHLPQVSVERIRDALARTMPDPHMLEISATTGQGMDAWLEWLAERHAGLAVAGADAHAHP